MKEKKGFTLVELLAVIALLAIVAVIGSYGVSGVKEAVKKQQWSNKVSLIESRAKVLGEDNRALLTGICTINGVTHDNAKVITVKNLIDKKYITTNEKDDDGFKIITNDITGDSINSWEICVYLEDNTVYAKLADATPEDSNLGSYIRPSVEITSINSTQNTIEVSGKATKGSGEIEQYMFSIDGGNNYTSVSSSALTYNYTFTGLNPGTVYDIKIKVIDSNGYSSNIANDSATTKSYNIPKVEIISSNATSDSITVNVKGTNGEAAIAKYMFSIDGGGNYKTEVTTALTYSYTFTGLDESKAYDIVVKAVDVNNFGSNPASKTIRTSASNVCTSGTTLADCIKSLYTEQGSNALYYHTSSLENSAGDNSYRYTGEDYALTSKASSYSQVLDTDASANGVIKYNCNDDEGASFVDDYFCYKYSSANAENYYYYLAYDGAKKHYSSLREVLNVAESDGYIKERVRNYVCFGSNANPCPEDNLYRVIGVFGTQVKLIKADFASDNLLGTNGYFYAKGGSGRAFYRGTKTDIAKYYWNYDQTNDVSSNNWSKSLLNTVNLNTNYLNNIGPTWRNKIALSTWYLGGWELLYPKPKAAYDAERGTKVYSGNPTTYRTYVGLMYSSDYGFASNPDSWILPLPYYHEESTKSWMYMDAEECTLSSWPGLPDSVDYIYTRGKLSGTCNGCSSLFPFLIRPTFYLNANVKYLSGNGSRNFPFIIE